MVKQKKNKWQGRPNHYKFDFEAGGPMAMPTFSTLLYAALLVFNLDVEPF